LFYHSIMNNSHVWLVLLTSYITGVQLPSIWNKKFVLFQKRHILEDSNLLEARISALDEDMDDMEDEEEEGEFRVRSFSVVLIDSAAHYNWDSYHINLIIIV